MRSTFYLALLLTVLMSVSYGSSPIPGGESSAPQNPYQIETDRVVCWSEPPALDGFYGSSEIISEFGQESKIANDFVIEEELRITSIRWWGVIYQYLPGDPIDFVATNLQFYADDDCVPGEMILEFVCVDGHDTLIHEDFDLFFEYWATVDAPCLQAGVYWLVAQCCDHLFPPQWARLASMGVIGCETMFWSPYFGYPEWTPTGTIWDAPWDASQELECEPCEPVPTIATSWGAIRGLYR